MEQKHKNRALQVTVKQIYNNVIGKIGLTVDKTLG